MTILHVIQSDGRPFVQQNEILTLPYSVPNPVVSEVRDNQACQQCGRCCDRWGWGQRGVPDDLLPWFAGNRKDILRHVIVWLDDGNRRSGADITEADLPRIAHVRYWQDTIGRELHCCPFLYRSSDGKAWCGIHDCKPAVCREFTPWTWQNHEFYGNCPACLDKSS
jgi:Fe-S-cluster containining protein